MTKKIPGIRTILSLRSLEVAIMRIQKNSFVSMIHLSVKSRIRRCTLLRKRLLCGAVLPAIVLRFMLLRVLGVLGVRIVCCEMKTVLKIPVSNQHALPISKEPNVNKVKISWIVDCV